MLGSFSGGGVGSDIGQRCGYLAVRVAIASRMTAKSVNGSSSSISVSVSSNATSTPCRHDSRHTAIRRHHIDKHHESCPNCLYRNPSSSMAIPVRRQSNEHLETISHLLEPPQINVVALRPLSMWVEFDANLA